MQFATAAGFAQRAEAGVLPESLSAAGVLASDRVVICTPRGLVVISLDADGEELPLDADFFPGCEWCQPFGGPSAIAGPEQPGLRLPNSRAHHYQAATAEAPLREGVAEAFRSRAPPSLSPA